MSSKEKDDRLSHSNLGLKRDLICHGNELRYVGPFWQVSLWTMRRCTQILQCSVCELCVAFKKYLCPLEVSNSTLARWLWMCRAFSSGAAWYTFQLKQRDRSTGHGTAKRGVVLFSWGGWHCQDVTWFSQEVRDVHAETPSDELWLFWALLAQSISC